MKRIITLLALVCLYTTLAFSQKKYELVIEKTDGTEITVNSEDIVRTYFRVNGSNKTDYELAVEKKDGTEVAVHTALIVKTYYREREEEMAYKTCPDGNHPHLIDLGLPSGTKWACCNVGASKPEDYGGYYAWGETQTKSDYSMSTYIYCDGYFTFYDIGTDISGTSYDAATANWGAPWRMPTYEECIELYKNTTSECTSLNGISGRKFIGPNGGTIFMSAAGYYQEATLQLKDRFGSYWASTLVSFYDDLSEANTLHFHSQNEGEVWMSFYLRNYGKPVRPVR